jgi:hypothetical protein
LQSKRLVVCLGLLLLATGCARVTHRAATPEEVVHAVYRHCLAGEYSRAAAYFDGGPAMWRSDPGLVRSVVDRVCDAQRVKAYEITDRQQAGEAATLSTRGYRDEERQVPYRTLQWQFVRRDGRWLIVRVV